nr:MAG TPA: hypothetical protein [Crassvirales sp.]
MKHRKTHERYSKSDQAVRRYCRRKARERNRKGVGSKAGYEF